MKTKTDIRKLSNALHHKGKVKFYSIQAFKDFVNQFKVLENSNSSKSEEEFFDKLLRKFDCRQIRTQLKMIEYTHKGKKHYYTPDFIILDKHGHVAVIEIKDYTEMAELVVRKKYDATQRFCKKYGFKYGLITKSFISYEQIAKSKFNQKIYHYMADIIKKRKRFTHSDYIKLKNDLDLTYETLNKEITKICIRQDWILNSLIHNTKSLIIKKHNL